MKTCIFYVSLSILFFVCAVSRSSKLDCDWDFSHDVKQVKQGYCFKNNQKLVQQVKLELQASYFYQAYSYYYSRADIALPGFSKFFEKMSKEEHKHAEVLMDYINKRGGSHQLNEINLHDVCETIKNIYTDASKNVVNSDRTSPCICYFMMGKRGDSNKDGSCGPRNMWWDKDWKDGLYGMEDALALERFVNSELLKLHKFAESDYPDPHLTHLLEHAYLEEQVNSIKEMGDMVTQLRRLDTTLGEYLFDKNL